MKKVGLFVVVLFCLPFALSAQKQTVCIYHFYAHERCPGDLKIEELTKRTLDSLFSNELRSEKITRKSLNFEKRKNERLVKNFNVSTIALIINIRDSRGKETFNDLTDWAFANVWDEGKFRKELQEKINEALTQISTGQ
jgi:hypothetical protein